MTYANYSRTGRSQHWGGGVPHFKYVLKGLKKVAGKPERDVPEGTEAAKGSMAILELATPFSNSFGQKVAVEAVTVIDWSVSLVGQVP